MIVEMSMQSLFAIIDMFFVSRLGSDPVAVIGLTGSLLALIFAVALGFGIGTTAMVARRIGEQNERGAAIVAVQAIILSLGFSLIIGTVGALSAPTS